jgi:hypothetical protein
MVITIMAMFALLACASLAIDVGQTAASVRSVQNSADAAALAAANDCARGVSIRSLTQYGNAATATCDMTSSTATGTAHNEVDRLFGTLTIPTQRSATAKWDGTVNRANVLPLAIADCEWSLALLDGTTDITVYVDDPKKQNGCNSVPGGFGQLARGDDGQCSITIDADGYVDGKPGGDMKKQVPCVTPLPRSVLVPMYSTSDCAATNCKGHGPYKILGFAEFKITGYSFNGSANDGTLGKDCPQRPGEQKNDVPKYCIRGDFIRFVAPGSATPGPSQNFGVVRVYLSS